ncbi:MAG: DUF2726 domain-containing protein [Alphaproteobacteria bacterium]|nr:DUF2726 domain-containing protein [Alphaproteobacteria bacterium]
MPDFQLDGLAVALLIAAAISLVTGALGGYSIAQLRPSDIELSRMQLRRVRRAPFSKQKLMNFSEFSVFRVIERDAALKRFGFRVMAQAPLGEILKSPNEKAFRAINGKRVDMLILDRGGWPVVAIEYQGEGHYDETSGLRDAIKKTALTRAGIGYLEIFPKDKGDAARLRSLVHEALGENLHAQRNGARALQEAIRAAHP